MLDLFVPTCARDLDQARILLASLDRFVERDVVTSMTVANIDRIANLEQVERLSSGKFHDCTRHARLEDFGMASPTEEANGWILQQVAKLLFARQARTEFYMVLDSKNLALNPISGGDLLSDGRAAWVLEPLYPRKRAWWRGSTWALCHRRFLRDPNRI